MVETVFLLYVLPLWVLTRKYFTQTTVQMYSTVFTLVFQIWEGKPLCVNKFWRDLHQKTELEKHFIFYPSDTDLGPKPFKTYGQLHNSRWWHIHVHTLFPTNLYNWTSTASDEAITEMLKVLHHRFQCLKKDTFLYARQFLFSGNIWQNWKNEYLHSKYSKHKPGTRHQSVIMNYQQICFVHRYRCLVHTMICSVVLISYFIVKP